MTHIVLYGDSMTEALGRPPQGLQNFLNTQAPTHEWNVENYGVGGTRSELVLYRMEFGYQHGSATMLPLRDIQPDLIILEPCSFNNAQDRTDGYDNYRRLFGEILTKIRQDAPNANVLMYQTIPPAPVIPDLQASPIWYHAGPEIFAYRAHWRVQYQALLADLIEEAQLPCIDIRKQVWAGEENGTPREIYICPDGVHPNATGIELITRSLAEGIIAQYDYVSKDK